MFDRPAAIPDCRTSIFPRIRIQDSVTGCQCSNRGCSKRLLVKTTWMICNISGVCTSLHKRVLRERVERRAAVRNTTLSCSRTRSHRSNDARETTGNFDKMNTQETSLTLWGSFGRVVRWRVWLRLSCCRFIRIRSRSDNLDMCACNRFSCRSGSSDRKYFLAHG